MTTTHSSFPDDARARRPLLALVTALGLLAAACTSSSDSPAAESDPTPTAGDAASADDRGDTDDEDESEPSGVRGVTDDTITIGFVYLDLDDVRERGIVSLNFGPQDEHMQLMVDRVNAAGGINGRQLVVESRAFSPVGATEARSACLELTEDIEVFAVLGAIRGDEVFCYTQQHETVAIANADLTTDRVERSDAPYASLNASRERTIQEFISVTVEQGRFDGSTVAVLSTDAVEVASDIAIPSLEAEGVDVAFEALVRGDGSLGGAAGELAVGIDSMKAAGVDTVVVVGDAVIAINLFIGAEFFPKLFFTDQGSASLTASRSDFSVFPEVYTFGGPPAVESFTDPRFQDECVAPWNEANPDDPVVAPTLVPEGEPSHTTGLLIACRGLELFTAIAEAAGPELNNATFAAALDGLGDVDFPGTGAASVGDGKFDAQDGLSLKRYNTDAGENDPLFEVIDS